MFARRNRVIPPDPSDDQLPAVGERLELLIRSLKRTRGDEDIAVTFRMGVGIEAQMVRRPVPLDQTGGGQKDEPVDTTGDSFNAFIFSQIFVANDLNGTPAQWLYGFTEAADGGPGYGEFADMIQPRTGQAYNLNEADNHLAGNGMGAYGDGVDPDNLDTGEFTFAIQPIPIGRPVVVRVAKTKDGTPIYRIDVTNGYDGGCD